MTPSAIIAQLKHHLSHNRIFAAKGIPQYADGAYALCLLIERDVIPALERLTNNETEKQQQ